MKTGIISFLLACALTLSGFSSGVAQAAPRPSGKCEQVGAKKMTMCALGHNASGWRGELEHDAGGGERFAPTGRGRSIEAAQGR